MNTISRRHILLGASGAAIAATGIGFGQRAQAAAGSGVSLYGLPLLTLQRGGSANHPVQVKAAQYLLRSHTPALAADGSFGPATHAAVVGLQKFGIAYAPVVGLKANGIVEQRTWTYLFAAVG